MNVIGLDSKGEEIYCDSECSPSEQLCTWCRTMAHHTTGLF